MKDISERDLEKNIPLCKKKNADHFSEVKVGNVTFGRNNFVVIAGPCTVENEEMVKDIAVNVKKSGAKVLRGGAYKPLTFPYRNDKMFELGKVGLEFLRKAGDFADLPVVTEVIDVRLVPLVAEYADMIQIGSRNMQNFPLLEQVAKTRKPILLKRHFGCSLRDWLGAAEYLLNCGNDQVVLCERGIVAPHTHQVTSRFIVDLQVVPAAHEVTHLPIIVDSSHSTFKRSYVAPVSRAAAAIGADGIILDVHPIPDEAAVDPLQALNYVDFDKLMTQIRGIAKVVEKNV